MVKKLIENIEEFEFSKLNTVNKSFEKISLENEDFSIKRENDRWEIVELVLLPLNQAMRSF